MDELKKFMKVKKEGIRIEYITLANLIEYFEKNIWTDMGFDSSLNLIRENRNVIHSFTKRDINEWHEFENSLLVYLEVLNYFIDRMSGLEDAIDDM